KLVVAAALLALSVAIAASPAPANQSSCYKRLFSFGDSLIDTGNYIVHFSATPERKAAMASSLFLVGEIGANDYIQPLFQNKTLEWVRPLVPRIIRSIALSIEALIELGAKTMYVPGIFPMGCTPLFLGIFPGDDRDPATGCLRWLNDLTLVHNHMLKSQLDELRRNHPGVSITYVDYYEEMLSLVTKPVENGFAAETVLDACYPVFVPGRGVVRCPDPSRYVSWDGVHLTEAAYKIMAHGMLDGPFAMPPIMSTCNRNC
uniref:SGNH hydrolase-type esterase domain-containing protein n=1 Tax=Aegilops tauschii subsp. strangulata TaxID=200361 RepID=A0A453DWC5_AEGTS